MSIAVLSQPLAPTLTNEFRILPAGVFRAADGRPANLDGWKIDAQIGAKLAALAATGDDLVIDYEHQSLLTKTNGQPAPAAGWFKTLQWREGEGLFAVNVRWTDKAKAMIAAKEYRFVSPVFVFDGNTGEVQRIVGMGLTNTPALSRLTDLGALAVNSIASAGRAPATKDSQHAIDSFNAVFGKVGVFHPDTSAEEMARLKEELAPAGTLRPAAELAHLTPDDAAKLRHSLPGVWAEDLS